jgi:hypothetical protein
LKSNSAALAGVIDAKAVNAVVPISAARSELRVILYPKFQSNRPVSVNTYREAMLPMAAMVLPVNRATGGAAGGEQRHANLWAMKDTTDSVIWPWNCRRAPSAALESTCAHDLSTGTASPSPLALNEAAGAITAGEADEPAVCAGAPNNRHAQRACAAPVGFLREA